MKNVDELFATMQQSVIDVWKKHLLSSQNNEHTILNDFYDSALSQIDSIIETYFGINGKTLLNAQSVIQSAENENSLDYLIELKEQILANKGLLGDDSEILSELDEFLSLIDSTIYKLRELCGIMSSEKIQKSIPDYVGYENDDVVESRRTNYIKNYEQFLNENFGVVPNRRYRFFSTCVDMNAEDVQGITHYDEMSENDYGIQDDYFNSEVFIVDVEEFKNKVDALPDEEIVFCGYNKREDILFAYCVNDIHWFYE